MRHTWPATLLLTLLLTACTTTPAVPTTPERFHVLGQMDLPVGEVPQVTAQSLTVAGIQLKTTGTTITDHGGYRYINTTYQVRNASSNGTPSSTPKHNVTFLAVDTQNTLLDTAVRTMKKADGTPANPSLALQVKPSANITPSGALGSQQSLQVFSSDETASLQGLPAIIEGVLPYGFVVDRVGGGRTLDANPGLNEYQGSVTVSVKVPLQNPIEDTPRSLVLSMVYAEDSETQVTEAPEERGVTNKVGARVLAATASRTNVFSGSSYPGKTRVICQVPVSRTQKAYLVNDVVGTVNPDFSKSILLPRDHSPTVKLGCGDVIPEGGNPERELVVQGFQTGKRVVEGGAYNRGAFRREGKTWVYTPGEGAGFKAGEEVEVTWPGVGGLPALQGRYRAAASPEGAPGFQIPVTHGNLIVHQIRVGDFNSDGYLDVLTLFPGHSELQLLLGKGNGTFQSARSIKVEATRFFATGDLDGDGNLDVVTSNAYSNELTILLGDGKGAFIYRAKYQDLNSLHQMTLADLDRDGHLDVLATSFVEGTISVLLGNGNGTLKNRVVYPVGKFPAGVSVADLNGDRTLDVIVSNPGDDTISVLLGTGDGKLFPQKKYPSPSLREVLIGDINEDGHLDVMGSEGGWLVKTDSKSMVPTTYLSVSLGKGDGDLSPFLGIPISITSVEGFGSLNLGDVNGDGHLDLVGSEYKLRLMLGNGDGTFRSQTAHEYSSESAWTTGSDLGDLNNDGKLDVILAAIADELDEDWNTIGYLKTFIKR